MDDINPGFLEEGSRHYQCPACGNLSHLTKTATDLPECSSAGCKMHGKPQAPMPVEAFIEAELERAERT